MFWIWKGRMGFWAGNKCYSKVSTKVIFTLKKMHNIRVSMRDFRMYWGDPRKKRARVLE